MATKIEMDAKRVNLYNAINKNLEQIVIHKTNYDFLTQQVNDWMLELKSLVDDTTTTEFTPEDFDAVLALRDEKLGKIVAIQEVEFTYYANSTIEEKVVEESPIVKIFVDSTPIIEDVIIDAPIVEDIVIDTPIVKEVPTEITKEILTEETTVVEEVVI